MSGHLSVLGIEEMHAASVSRYFGQGLEYFCPVTYDEHCTLSVYGNRQTFADPFGDE
jgi:hypothetical protein